MKKFLPILFVILFVFTKCKNESIEDLLIEAKKLDSAQYYSEAISCYDKILKLDINRTDIFLRRAIDKGLIKDTEGEIRDLKEIVKSETENVSALYHLGIAYQNLGRYQESIESLSKAIQIKEAEKKESNPGAFQENNFTSGIAIPEVYFERGLTFYKADSVQRAVTDFSYTIRNEYSLKESYYYRGSSFLNLKNEKRGLR